MPGVCVDPRGTKQAGRTIVTRCLSGLELARLFPEPLRFDLALPHLPGSIKPNTRQEAFPRADDEPLNAQLQAGA